MVKVKVVFIPKPGRNFYSGLRIIDPLFSHCFFVKHGGCGG
jgi:hypothetical protein